MKTTIEDWHQTLVENNPAYAKWHEHPNRSSHHLAVLLLVLAVATTRVVTIAYAGAPGQSGAHSSASWHSVAEAIRLGEVQAPENIFEVNFMYDLDNSPGLSVRTINRKKGYVPTYPQDDYAYVLRVTNQNGQELYSQGFNLPDVFPEILPNEHAASKANPPLVKKGQFSLTIPWYNDAKDLVIETQDGDVVATATFSRANVINNQANFNTIRGDEVVSGQAPSTSLLPSVTAKALAAGSNDGYLDLTFISDNYTDMTAFHADADRFAQYWLTLEPYHSRAAQIRFHYVDNTVDLGCYHDATINRLIVCNDSTVVQQINNAGAPYDKIGVIVNDSVYGGSGGSTIAVSYNGSSGPPVFGHELGGHAVGHLTDEYIYGYTEYNMINCSATNPSPAWIGLVAPKDYNLGCDFSNYYRSSPSSLMLTLSAPYFNAVSQRAVNAQMNIYTSAFSNATSPVAAISSPSSGAIVSGTVSVAATASDDQGVAWAELYIDNVLYTTLYRPPFTFSWDSRSVPDGSHTVQVKTIDAAANVGSSSVVTVTTNNGITGPAADTTAPTVAISSPGNGATVSGSVPVSITASDNVGVARVDLYVNNQLVGSDTTSPYSVTWDSTATANGSYTLQAKAYDAAGNVGTSGSVTINVSNSVVVDTTAPTVVITSPVNGTKVQSKGSLSIKTVASDDTSVHQITIAFDGKIIKTCLDVTSCSANQSVKQIKAGTHVITASAIDPTGNVGTASVTITK